MLVATKFVTPLYLLDQRTIESINKVKMSNQQSSFTSFSSSSYSYSSSSSNNDGQVTGSRHTQQTYTDDSGTTVKSTSQNIGEPVVREERHYDNQGRELLSGTDGAGSNRRIEDVSDEQKQRDREYEERIEEEYAKREGGA
jgi:hypothetical protein